MEFWFGVFVGFIASTFGSVLMWLTVGRWMVRKDIDNGFKDLEEGKYDEMIKTATLKACSVILTDESLKLTIKQMISGYAKSFADQAVGMIQKALQEFFGISGDQAKQMAQQFGGSGGFNPDKLIGRIINSIFPE